VKRLLPLFLLSLLTPLILSLILIILFNLFAGLGLIPLAEFFIHTMNGQFFLPLHILHWTGAMGDNPEVFYKEWSQLSAMTSWAFQSLILFICLKKRRNSATRSSKNPSGLC
jgi:hypothetical protein